MDFPGYVRVILARLRARGYAAYAVGGCVRDTLLGRTPGDWDLTTSAQPEETAAVFDAPEFRVIIGNGLRHGTVSVAMADDSSAVCEITTFRADGSYSDHRRPDAVRFVSDLRQDLARRDFTVNAMASAPAEAGAEEEFHDPFGGRQDLAAGLIRCVGEADVRFDEDALRILRGLRFAARYSFAIEPGTAAAMHRQAPLLAHIAPERIGAELTGIFAGGGCGAMVEEFADIFRMLLPGCDCTAADGLLSRVRDWHLRLALLCRGAEPEILRRTVLHYALGADMAERIACLIRWRDAPTATHAALCRIADAFGQAGTAEYFAFRRAIAPDDPALAEAEARVTDLFASGACYNIATLAADGRALMREAGIPAGPRLGAVLRRLTEDVIAGRLENERAALIAAARRYAQEDA